jgi:dTMP kinase
MKKALFITFEGGEGSGKSTHLTSLYTFLKSNKVDVVKTREPGGTESAEEIRNLLVHGEPNKWDKKTEALLMFAARTEHWQRFIQPSLEKGQWVLCDRFLDSSLAYQGYGRRIDLTSLNELYRFGVGNRLPDITFLLDIDPIIGIQRTKKRQSFSDERFEKESLEFHQNVRDGYLSLAQQDPTRFIILDATLPMHMLEILIQKHILKFL